MYIVVKDKKVKEFGKFSEEKERTGGIILLFVYLFLSSSRYPSSNSFHVFAWALWYIGNGMKARIDT